MDKDVIRKRQLERWLTIDYVIRMETIRRCEYLGITPPENKYDLIREAHEKDQEYRSLVGLEPLETHTNFFTI